MDDRPDWRSAPAQKTRFPWPVTTMALMRASVERRVNAEHSSSTMRSVKALLWEGR